MSPIALLKNFRAIFAFAFFAAISACGPVAAVESQPTASKSPAETRCESNPACLVDFHSKWRSIMPDTVKAMINAGADVDAQSSHGLTPLHYAARYNKKPEVIAVLIGAGADANAKAKDGETPLHQAAYFNTNLAVIAALIEAGSNVNARGNANFTPLHRAVQNYQNHASFEIITALIEAGAFVNVTTDDGRTPMFFALKAERSPEIITALVNAGADKDAAEKQVAQKEREERAQIAAQKQQHQRKKATEPASQICTESGIFETWHCPASSNFAPCEKTNSSAVVGYCRIITDFAVCKFCTKPKNWKQEPNYPIKVNFYRGRTKKKEFWFCRFDNGWRNDFICD